LLDARREGAIVVGDFVQLLSGIRNFPEQYAHNLFNDLDVDKDGRVVEHDLRNGIARCGNSLMAPLGASDWATDLFCRIREAIDRMPGGGGNSAAGAPPVRDVFERLLHDGGQATPNIDELRLRIFLQRFDASLTDLQAQHCWALLEHVTPTALAFDDFADMFSCVSPLVRDAEGGISGERAGEEIFIRIRSAIAQSGHALVTVFNKLCSGTGRLWRPTFEQFIRSFEPSISVETIDVLWRMGNRSELGVMTLEDFRRCFEPLALTAPPAPPAPPLAPVTLPAPCAVPYAPVAPPVATVPTPCAPPGSQPQATDWVEHVDPVTRQRYYYSASLGKSSWTDPSCRGSTPLPPAAPGIVDDWVEQVDAQTGQRYYYSASLGKSEWTKPAVPAPTVDDWVEHTDPGSGRKYYYSALQRRSIWNDPRPLAAALAAPAPPAPAPPAPVAPQPPVVAPAAPSRPWSAPAAPVANDDWVEHLDAQTGRRYYYSASRQTSSWTHPASLAAPPPPVAPAAPPPVASDWTAHLDQASGRTYYHNVRDGRTQWTDPR